VFLSPGDLRRLAASLAMPESSFIQVYCRWIREGEREHLSLKERANFDCIFWKEGCTVYQVRPLQCRTFPFWPRNLDSPEDWERVSRECPGAGRGDLHEAKEIEAYLAEQDTERPLSRPTGGGSRNI
jgi:Fe-S-cluster containining protein